MYLKTFRQTLKALAEDNRLRIMNLLFERRLSVSQICSTLKITQPSASKHLVRLRLLKLVSDKREGNQIYYSINKNIKPDIYKILNFIFSEYKNIEIFQKDLKRTASLKM